MASTIAEVLVRHFLKGRPMKDGESLAIQGPKTGAAQEKLNVSFGNKREALRVSIGNKKRAQRAGGLAANVRSRGQAAAASARASTAATNSSRLLAEFEAGRAQKESAQRRAQDKGIGKTAAQFGSSGISSTGAQRQAKRLATLQGNVQASSLNVQKEQILAQSRTAVAGALAAGTSAAFGSASSNIFAEIRMPEAKKRAAALVDGIFLRKVNTVGSRGLDPFGMIKEAATLKQAMNAHKQINLNVETFNKRQKIITDDANRRSSRKARAKSAEIRAQGQSAAASIRASVASTNSSRLSAEFEAGVAQKQAIQKQAQDTAVGRTAAQFGAAGISSISAQQDAERQAVIQGNIQASDLNKQREQILAQARSAITGGLAANISAAHGAMAGNIFGRVETPLVRGKKAVPS